MVKVNSLTLSATRRTKERGWRARWRRRRPRLTSTAKLWCPPSYVTVLSYTTVLLSIYYDCLIISLLSCYQTARWPRRRPRLMRTANLWCHMTVLSIYDCLIVSLLCLASAQATAEVHRQALVPTSSHRMHQSIPVSSDSNYLDNYGNCYKKC